MIFARLLSNSLNSAGFRPAPQQGSGYRPNCAQAVLSGWRMVLVRALSPMRHTKVQEARALRVGAVLLGFEVCILFAAVCANSGENGRFPVLLAAWAPPSRQFSWRLVLLLHAEAWLDMRRLLLTVLVPWDACCCARQRSSRCAGSR